MTITASLGVPRLGADRELKWALEAAWRADAYDDLRAVAADLRARHWRLQVDRGIERVPVGDASLYDHVLDAALAVGAVPARFGGHPFDPESGDDDDLRRLFALARGGRLDGAEVAPLELTKWFDTNYHYLVPELAPDQTFTARPARLVAHLAEAHALGVPARVVLLGPVTLLALAKRTDGGDPVELLDRLLPAYAELVAAVRAAGAIALQVDEPLLVTDLTPAAAAAYPRAIAAVREAADDAEVTLATYFGDLGPATSLAAALPVDVVHLDLVRGSRAATDAALAAVAARPDGPGLSLGLVDGRNVWRSDLDALAAEARRVRDRVGPDRLHLAPSCSLLHLPVDVGREEALDPELRSWLAFATQRLDEVRVLRAVVDGDEAEVAAELAAARHAVAARRASTRVHRPDVAERLDRVTPAMARRASDHPGRRVAQQAALGLPPVPTTTIGSFPQTREVRDLRRRHRAGEVDDAAYEAALRTQTERVVREQEAVGLDVLVHGELERTDMVEHFGARLDGFATTAHGWVQSYGSRAVKPPLLYGDVARPAPMTVGWTTFAAGLTDRPVKGMLTGPVTILQWSFVRDDQPRVATARQIALALRDEVADLVAAGTLVVQVDEPALREGLPLRRADHAAYLAWATEAYRLATSVAPDEVQVHTHMCYAELGDVVDAIAALDVDVISLEASRSHMEVLDDLVDHPTAVGPGVWDIHSPRVPTDAELDDLVGLALKALGPERLWVNPDCGLKTRGWDEVREALRRMVAAAHRARTALAG